MCESEVIGFTKNKTQIKIVPQNWKFMDMGEGHIIVQNTSRNDKLYGRVLSICRHQIDTIPQQLGSIYHEVLIKIQNICPYLLQRQEVIFQSEYKNKFIVMMKAMINVPIQNCKVFIAQNLAQSKDNYWDYYLEFKPKTILPDIYSEQFINAFSTEHQLDSQQLISMLTNSPLIQKTRWYKKNALKEVKKNNNPFEIFSFKTQNTPDYLKKVKQMKKEVNQNTPLPSPPLSNITNQMIHSLVSKTNVLSSILKMQLLFTEPHDFLEPNVYKLWNRELNKESICEMIYNEVSSELKATESFENYLQSLFGQAPKASSVKGQRNEIQKIMRFLISWTWKDVSLILRFKLDAEGKEIMSFDLRIIDYEIKQASKLAETIKKDQIFLKYYLTSKRIL